MRSSQSVHKRAVADLTAIPFAHRGLHGGAAIENSRAAFDAALAAGHGIELDVQESRDGAAIVFHDYDLARLTAARGRVDDRTRDELAAIRLKGSNETLPALPEILLRIAGRGALLIEVKSKKRRPYALCRAVADALEGYGGQVGVMSFNPQIGAWFARHAPRIARGLVVTEDKRRGLRGRIARRFALKRSRADFLAYDVRDLPARFAARSGLPVLTWTVRSAADRAAAAAHADQIIYESGVA